MDQSPAAGIAGLPMHSAAKPLKMADLESEAWAVFCYRWLGAPSECRNYPSVKSVCPGLSSQRRMLTILSTWPKQSRDGKTAHPISQKFSHFSDGGPRLSPRLKKALAGRSCVWWFGTRCGPDASLASRNEEDKREFNIAPPPSGWRRVSFPIIWPRDSRSMPTVRLLTRRFCLLTRFNWCRRLLPYINPFALGIVVVLTARIVSVFPAFFRGWFDCFFFSRRIINAASDQIFLKQARNCEKRLHLRTSADCKTPVKPASFCNKQFSASSLLPIATRDANEPEPVRDSERTARGNIVGVLCALSGDRAVLVHVQLTIRFRLSLMLLSTNEFGMLDPGLRNNTDRRSPWAMALLLPWMPSSGKNAFPRRQESD